MAELSTKRARLNLTHVLRRDGMATSARLPLSAGPFLLFYRQKEDAMVRDPWTVAAALFAFGVIGWVVVAERPPKNQGRIEAAP